ncbi:MAG: TolC family protein [Labilithrix sp.]|nr:TolC family protein [Labilithrix sp.]
MHERAKALLAAAILLGATAARAEGAPERTLPRISFDDAIRRASTKNPQNEIAVAEIQRSQALVEQARAAWLPTLNANATYTRLDADRVLNDRVILSANQLSANIGLAVPIVAPRAWVAHARALENVDISKLSAVEAKRQVALLTGRAFLTVLAQKRVLASVERARDTSRAHEEFAKSRLAGGVGNRLDAVRASQERATNETRVQNQLIALARAQEALGVLVGENGPIDTVDEAQLAGPPPLATALGGAEARSDVVAERERVESSRKAVRDSYTEYLPVLSLTAQPFYQNPPTFSQPTTGWQAQVLLSLPIFDGGNRYGLTHEREAVEAQNRARLDAALRQAKSEVRAAFVALERADEALVQAREAAKLAAEALDLTEQAYRAGATSNIEVVDAERRARDAAAEAAIVEDTARQARLDLLVASGRFPGP